jgi:predicted methyltransferase
MLRYPLAVAAALLFTGAALAANAPIPAAITAAVADANRPAEQRADDAVRMPAAVVAFSGMKPGDKVVDFLPGGGGYYTRIFSKVVGPQGKVYAAIPAENLARRPASADGVKAIAADAAYGGNIAVISPPIANFAAPEPVDIAWTSNNYHDLKNANDAAAMLALNKGIFNALKPGGIYFVVDHRAAAGSGFTQTNTSHRIDPEALKAEIVQAGFVFDGESNIMLRPNDNLTTQSVVVRILADHFPLPEARLAVVEMG